MGWHGKPSSFAQTLYLPQPGATFVKHYVCQKQTNPVLTVVSCTQTAFFLLAKKKCSTHKTTSDENFLERDGLKWQQFKPWPFDPFNDEKATSTSRFHPLKKYRYKMNHEVITYIFGMCSCSEKKNLWNQPGSISMTRMNKCPSALVDRPAAMCTTPRCGVVRLGPSCRCRHHSGESSGPENTSSNTAGTLAQCGQLVSHALTSPPRPWRNFHFIAWSAMCSALSVVDIPLGANPWFAISSVHVFQSRARRGVRTAVTLKIGHHLPTRWAPTQV